MLTTFTCFLAAALGQHPLAPQPTDRDLKQDLEELRKQTEQIGKERAALETAFGWTNYIERGSKPLWRGFKQKDFPEKGWQLVTRDWTTLTSTPGAGLPDLMTVKEYGDFELTCIFQCSPKANSGIIYRSTEKHGASWMTGPEYQVIDDAGNGLTPDDAHSCGALYDILKPAADKAYEPGDRWNRARIYVRSGLIQHWLNEKKVAEIEAFGHDGQPTAAWTRAIAASKFKDYDGFGLQPRGSVVLQNHGDVVTFKDLRIRALHEPVPGEVALFNGQDLAGWTAVVPDLAAKQEDQTRPWTVKDGVLACSGSPGGYLRTNEKYANFVLRLQWRFDPARGAGNSGVLLRMNGADKVWPRSIEAQLHSGNAGDFWNLGDMTMGGAPDRTKGRNTKKTHGAERPLGQWNEYEIICQRGNISLTVNGERLNQAGNCEETPGHICLQSEGAYIEFRDIRIVPLP